MIGNDIVDLNFARIHNDWRRPGYLDKIFMESEQQYILDSEDPDRLLWTLWSMKESVYKASLKDSDSRKFNPKSFACKLFSKTKGRIQFNQNIYETRSDHQDDHIHTLAFSKDLTKELYNGLIKLKRVNSVSEEVHMSLVKSVSKRKKWAINSLNIKKDHLGIPGLYRSGIKTSTLCSMSHHGAYGAYLTAD